MPDRRKFLILRVRITREPLQQTMKGVGTISTMRFELTYVGRVQGVGFRAAAKSLANEHGVTGWVRNEANGTVALVAEGEKARVEAYLDALRERWGQNITDEKLETKDEERGYAGFEIR
jgi:acylphosphatase